jgi:NAD(P)-dependent dehydrogenase (short-subunit alcohol dehydrogenase family)
MHQYVDINVMATQVESLGLPPGAVVVTGGARGIGARMATELARAGVSVAIVYRSRGGDAARVVRDIETAGGRAIAVAADIGRDAEVVRTFERIDRELGGVCGLVNNAVDAGPPARFVDQRAEDVERVVRTNVFGAFACTREAVKRMSTRLGGRGGAIVSLSSAVAITTGAPGTWVHFAACKSAIETMSRGLAKELAPEGIRANVVRCGVVLTETRMTQNEDYRNRLIAQVPIGRMADVGEIAAAALWLLSDRSSYVTGAELDVTGGF